MAIFYVKQKSVCNPVVLSLSLFQKGKQPLLHVRFFHDFRDVVAVFLNCVFDDLSVNALVADNHRLALDVRWRHFFDVCRLAHSVVYVAFAHTALHAFHFENNLFHICLRKLDFLSFLRLAKLIVSPLSIFQTHITKSISPSGELSRKYEIYFILNRFV